MFKRVMIIGLITITAFLMLGTEAKAQNIWDVFFFWGSIDCRSLLNGLGKKLAPSTEVECIALIKEFVGTCRNHGGNADSSGSHIFQLQTGTVVGTSIQATGCTLDKQSGKWICNESITDEQLQAELGQAIGDSTALCPNPNFTFQIDLVTKMCPTINVNLCHVPSTTTPCDPRVTQSCNCDVLQDTVTAKCSVPTGSAPGTQYACSEITDVDTECTFP